MAEAGLSVRALRSVEMTGFMGVFVWDLCGASVGRDGDLWRTGSLRLRLHSSLQQRGRRCGDQQLEILADFDEMLVGVSKVHRNHFALGPDAPDRPFFDEDLLRVKVRHDSVDRLKCDQAEVCSAGCWQRGLWLEGVAHLMNIQFAGPKA